MTVFPNGKHDDQADSTAQFLDWFKTPFIGQNMYELLRREAEAAEQRRKPQPTKTVYAPGSEPEDSLPVSKRLAAFCRLPLEGDGFEPSVPPRKLPLGAPFGFRAQLPPARRGTDPKRGTKSSRCLTAPRLFI